MTTAKEEATGDMERFSGTARRRADAAPDEALLERITMLIDGVERARIERVAPFDLELDDGERVRVELGKELAIEPGTSRRGPWKKLAEDPALAELADRAPGPHVAVEIRRERLDDGVRVDVLAEHVEHAFAEGGGHRSAPARKTASITARAVASGEDASLAMDRIVADLAANDSPKKMRRRASRRARRLRWRGGWIGGGSSAVAFGGAALVPFSPLTVDLVVAGIATATLTFTLWGLRHVPRFILDEKHVEDVQKSPDVRVLTIAAAPFFMLAAPPFVADVSAQWTKLPPATPAVNGSMGCCVALVVFALLLTLGVLTTSRRSMRLLRVLLAAPPLPSGPVRAWGSFEGTVRDPTPVSAEGELAAVMHVVHETVTEGSDPNIFVERVLSKGTFHVDRGGTSFEVDPEGAHWGSAVRIRVQGKDARRRTEKHVVPIGGSVLIAGNAVRQAGANGGSFAATGPESLLFFAAGRGHSARTAARRLFWVRRATLTAILACGLSGLALARWVEPHLPPFHMPQTD